MPTSTAEAAAAGPRRGAAALALALLWLLALSAPGLEGQALPWASAARQGGYVAAAAMVVYALDAVRHPNRLLVLPVPLIVAMGWCWISLTWSAAPRAAVPALVLTTLVAFILLAAVRVLGTATALAVTRVMLVVALAANFATVALAPDIGIIHHNYGWSMIQWCGFMGDKNAAGALCAATALMFLFDVPSRWRPISWGVAAAAVLFAILTISHTALAAGAAGAVFGAVVALSAAPADRFLAGHRSAVRIAAIALGAGLVLAMVWLTFSGSDTLQVLSDPTLASRRGQVWGPLVQYYLDHPWRGAGFASFWTDGATAPQQAGRWTDAVAHGHNGYLDLLVQLGLPGLLIVLAAMLAWPLMMLGRSLGPRPQTSALATALLVFGWASNLTESGLLNRDSLWNVFLLLALAMLADQARPAVVRVARRSRSEPTGRSGGADRGTTVRVRRSRSERP